MMAEPSSKFGSENCVRISPWLTSTRRFAANTLYLEIIRLAYNLVTAFQQLCLPDDWQTFTLQRLRHKLFLLPGQLARPQNRPILRLNSAPKIELLARHILARIKRLPLLC